MATYFGQKSKNRIRLRSPMGGPPALRPPTPLSPRGGGGNPNPYNQRGTKGVLPGPGPNAGGRYHWYGPGFPQPGAGPIKTPRSIPDTGWGRRMQHGMLRKSLGLLGPIGKSLSLAGDLMDLWAMTQEEVPGGQFYKYNMELSGFELLKECPPAGGTFCGVPVVPYCGPDEVVKWTSNDPNLSCGTVGQTGYLPISTATIPNSNVGWVSYGPTNHGTIGRMQIRLQWRKVVTSQPMVLGPWQYPQPIPAVVQPIPGPATPPEPAYEEAGYPEPTRQPGVSPRPGVKPGTKMPPYWNPGTGVPNLPKPGEEKWVLKDPKIADIYGKLTEMGDALDCFEKNSYQWKGSKIGDGKIIRHEKKGRASKDPLHERLLRAAGRIAYRPETVDWAGFLECMVIENAKDEVIGRANKLANRITRNPYYKRPVGVGRGAFAQRF